MSDTRIYFAAERTLLAWVRTGLTVMVLGFVVARFGLFLSLMSATGAVAAAGSHPAWPTSALGVALIGVGTAVILGALRNHLEYVRTIPAEDVPRLPLPYLATFLSASVAVAGLVIGLYLALV